MKRRRIIVLIISLISIVALPALWITISRAGMPRFIPAPSGFKVLDSKYEDCERTDSPTRDNGLIWIFSYSDDRYRCYLYDIDRKKVLGELVNSSPRLITADHTKVLLEVDSPSIKERLIRWCERLSGGRFHVKAKTWGKSLILVDCRQSEPKELARFDEPEDDVHGWELSPDSHYCFAHVWYTDQMLLCDLKSNQISTRALKGDPFSWWDNSKILYISEHDYCLYDLVKNTSSVLVGLDEQKKFFAQQRFGINLSTNYLGFWTRWEGTQQQAYLRYDNSFVAKVDYDGRLQPLAKDFKFDYSGRFDSSGRYYAYCDGDSIKGSKSGSVFVRDLQTRKTRTLVEDTGEKGFRAPKWYRNSIIFTRSNHLWRIKLTETNATRLFTPE